MSRRRTPLGVQWQLTGAAALATFLAALSVSPTIEAGSWLGRSIIVIVAVAVVGGLGRQLGLPRTVVTLATTGTALLSLTWLFVRDVAVWGVLPGTGAWAALSDLVREGTRVVWAEAPPVSATEGTTLLVVAGVAVVAVVVDALAVSWRRAGLAGIPLLSLYLVPAAVLPDGVPWPLFVISAIGWLMLLLVESRDRLGRWGRTLSLRAGDPMQPAPLQVGGTGRRLGAMALVVAVGVPILLPAFSEGILGSGAGSDGEGGGPSSLRRAVAVNPIVDLKRDISRGQDIELLRYTTDDPTPSYLRLATLDRFDGTSWVLADVAAPASQQASDGLPTPPGLLTEVARTPVETDFAVTALNDVRLPLPYPVTRVEVDGDWRWDAETFDVFSATANGSTVGLTYQASSLDVEPTAAQLEAAAPPSALLDPMLAVPDDVTAVLTPTVAEVTSGAPSDYAKALAIQSWFRESFTYSLETRPGNSVSDLEAFLSDQVGYCEQFAATMALMARVAGIPSRVQVGFTPGSSVGEGVWSVSAHDAHAWPELWFEGVGWVRFEPTPGGGDGNAAPAWAPPPLTDSERPGGGGPGGTDRPGRNPSVDVPQQVPQLSDEALRRRGEAATDVLRTTTPSVADTAKSWWWVGVLLLGAVGGLLALTPAAERWLLRRRRRRALGAEASLEAAWAEIRDTMTDLDLQSHPWDTVRDVRQRLSRRGDLSADDVAALNRLTTALERTRYAGAHPSSGDVEVWGDADRVTSTLLRSASPRALRRATWWPVSARQRLQLRWGRAGQRLEGLASRASQRLASVFARGRPGVRGRA